MTCEAPVHGNLTAYKRGCRCPAALRAGARCQKQYRTRAARGEHFHVDAAGTRRRIQALAAIGWPARELGQRLGVTAQAVSLFTTRATVYGATAAKVAALYEELWNQPGPSNVTRKRAEKSRWPQPLELDDDRIDDPTYQPQLHRLTPQIDRQQRHEQTLATIAHLTERDVPAHEIARHAGITARTVVRYRKQLREAS